jgi:geranylgeranyl pyrophosphate synthase
MDNDLIRRGKPATHAQFGEWKAILAGDALLIASFNELSNIRHQHFHEILKFMTWATGAKGLIKGQFLDLSAKNKFSVSDVVRIHELKTARLIQLCTVGSYLLNFSSGFRGKIEFMRMGREIGLSFQLFDDLTELAHTKVSTHEKEINPFIQNGELALKELKDSYQRLRIILSKHHLVNVEKMLNNYFASNQEFLLKNFQHLEDNSENNLNYLKDWLTSFV